jgi:pyridoxamine 5'-phosphate oxidase
MRRAYARGELSEVTAPTDWFTLFGAWFDDAVAELPNIEANAMQVATVDEDGNPAVRTVLLKAAHPGGVEFYTNYESSKGRQLDAHPFAAAVLAWVPLERQVRISGPVTRVAREHTEAYWATRPRGSQLGAWASPQSSVLASRADLDERFAAAERRFGSGEIPAPPHWGGYLIHAHTVEFWQGRPDRLHDRLQYTRVDADVAEDVRWTIERLAP